VVAELKNVQNETNKHFLVGNTKINVLTNQGKLRMKLYEIIWYEVRRILLFDVSVKAKMLTFVFQLKSA